MSRFDLMDNSGRGMENFWCVMNGTHLSEKVLTIWSLIKLPPERKALGRFGFEIYNF